MRLVERVPFVVVVMCGAAVICGCAVDKAVEPMIPVPEQPPDAGDSAVAVIDPNDIIPPLDDEGCPAIYAQDLLPSFELTIHPQVWEMLEWEWNHGKENHESGIDAKPQHPLLEFRYGDIVIRDAKIRLRGNPLFWYPIPEAKMQFQITFDKHRRIGHFQGVKRIALEASNPNRSFLRDRLALAFMRDVGIPAPCANHARVHVNGEYYGIFTSIEKIDPAFLERVFEDPTGDLWKRAKWTLKTNEDTATDERLRALRNASTTEEIIAYLDLEQALRVYAAQALMPDGDGAWAGGLNYYLYDDPSRGKFVLLPWDLDGSFDRFNNGPNGPYPDNPDPYSWEKPDRSHGRPWYDISLQDPMWFATYIAIIDEILRDGYHPEDMLGRIDGWTEQIRDAVLEDTNKPFTNDQYLDDVAQIREHVLSRYEFVDQWLVCWQSGGVDDGDGSCVMP